MSEACAGCDVEADQHPWVAIVGGAPFEAVPICGPCHVDPGHRKHLVKGHFFQRHQAVVALAAAGSSTISG